MATAVEVKEHGMIFQGWGVRAVLEDRKRQTRRVMTPHNSVFGSAPTVYWKHADFSRAWKDGDNKEGGEYLHVPCHVKEQGLCEICDRYGWPGTVHRLYPRIQPGDLIWGRETFCHAAPSGFDARDDGGTIWYRATDEGQCEGPWHPSIHMPRWASRLILPVTEVRAQRVQDISWRDCRDEGIPYLIADGCESRTWEGEFERLWDQININRGYSWESNPPVWAYTFERMKS